MELYRIIRELLQERDRVQRIIESLEQVTPAGRTRVPAKKRRGRKSMDRAARDEVSARMKRYWAQRRAEQHAKEMHSRDSHAHSKDAHPHSRDAHSKDHRGEGKG